LCLFLSFGSLDIDPTRAAGEEFFSVLNFLFL